MNQQRLTRLQLSPVSKPKVRSLINQREACRLVIVHGIRYGVNRGRLCNSVFRKTSEAQLREDSLTRFESIDADADLLNRPRDLETGSKRKRRFDLILPRDQQEVWEI